MAIEFVNWLEIPVLDLSRARKFYETVFSFKMIDLDVGGETYACFPSKSGQGYNGALVQYDFTRPAKEGVLVYLDANPDINVILTRIVPAGGQVFQGRTDVAPGMGCFAIFEDTEGNRLALHAMQ